MQIIKLVGLFKSTISLLLIILCLIGQNISIHGLSYPNIISGTCLLSQAATPIFFNRTFENSFPSGSAVMCAHAISGFSFQPPSSSQVTIDFATSIRNCTRSMIRIQSFIKNNTLVNIKISYLAITNSQTSTQFIFKLFQVFNGTSFTNISDQDQTGPRSQVYEYNYTLPNISQIDSNFSQSGQIVTYPLLHSMNLGVNQIISFQIVTSYDERTGVLKTNFSVNDDTYVQSAKVQVVLFRTMYNQNPGQFVTYDGQNSFVYGSSITYDIEFFDYDASFFKVFLGLRSLRFDLNHLIFFIGDDSAKECYGEFRQSPSPPHLYLNTNYLFVSNLLDDSVDFFYFAFVKNTGSANQTSKQIASNDPSSILTPVLAGIGVLAILGSSFFIYKKCNIGKRLIRKPFTIDCVQNIRFET